MDFPQLKQLILQAHANGTLITEKHHPDKVSTIYTPYRTVVSKSVADNLESFINSEDYSVHEYHNTDYPLSPLYFTITPNSASTYSVAASGVTGNVPINAMDTLVIVSGGTAGIHMFGTSSSDIVTQETNGRLINGNKIH
jgi:hypothetical protein